MAVSTTNGFDGPYTANGVTTSFPFTFTAPSTAEVAVLLRAADGTETTATGYTVTLGSGSGGTVVFAAAPASGVKVIPYLNPEFTQQISFEDGAAWLAAPVNEGYDRSAARDQALKRDLGRAGLSVMGEAGIAFPASAARVGKYLAFDASGNAYPASGTGADGALRDDLASANGPALVAGAVAGIASITLLAALAPAAGLVRYVTTGAAQGWWACVSGSTPTDTLNGLYKASDTAGFYWARVWDGVNGKPEWFGAVKDSGSGGIPAANVLAITACMGLCPITVLEAGDYFISAAIRVPPYRALEGQGSYRAQSGNGTRIVVTSATADVLAVGLASYPAGGVNDFAKASRVTGLSLGRSTPVTPPAVLNPELGAAGLRMTFALHCQIEDVYADDHTIGMYFNGVVRSLVKDCKAFRQTSGTTGTGDFWRGFWADGGGSYGLSGGNGSLFLIDCNASIGGTPALTTSEGFTLTNAFVDTFLIRPEATATRFGIVLDGDSAAGNPAHIDVCIEQPVLDGITGTGIEVRETNDYTAIEIRGGYIALAGGSAFAGYHIHDCQGVTIIGGQVWGVNSNAAGANVFGLYADTVGRLSVTKLKAIGCKRPFGLDAVADFELSGIVNNYGQAGSQAAVFMENCTIGQVSAAITGQGNAFPQGIHAFGTGNVRITIDPTGVNPACINGGATNKTQINGVPITTPGYYTSAGAGGSSGAGVQVIGITA